MRRSLLTFVVAGGGFSGVEAVAELNDFVRAAAKSFRNVRPEEIRVLLLHSGELILPELPESLAAFAQRLLMKRGVELRLRTASPAPRRTQRSCRAASASPTRTLVGTVPSGPDPLVAALPLPYGPRPDRDRRATWSCSSIRASGPSATAPSIIDANRGLTRRGGEVRRLLDAVQARSTDPPAAVLRRKRSSLGCALLEHSSRWRPGSPCRRAQGTSSDRRPSVEVYEPAGSRRPSSVVAVART